MKFQLRPYQQQASDAAVQFFRTKTKKNAIIVIPTGGGKSLILADIAHRLQGNTLILQPNKEILQQNYAKIRSYNIQDVSIFSASLNIKCIDRITLATIGSVYNQKDAFSHFQHIIVDECHLCGEEGRYKELFKLIECKVLGLTATPYRLQNYRMGCMLRFLTRTRKGIFKKVLYVCQVGELLQQGFLSQIQYFDLTRLDLSRVRSNSKGSEYDDKSLLEEYKRTQFSDYLESITRRVMNPKDGHPRRGILVFTRFISESELLAESIGRDKVAILTGDTPPTERDSIIQRFKNGDIQVLTNVGILTTGFDYPELDTIIMARPTKSLSLYYQIVGRCIRPHPDKHPWFIDISGTLRRFGKAEDLRIHDIDGNGTYDVYTNGRRLTNIFL